MAARNGLQCLARTIAGPKQLLPVRGGGGGPVKMAPVPEKPLPLWDEVWWHDGQVHSQPALDYVGEEPFWPFGKALLALGTALGVTGATYYSMIASWTPSKAPHKPMQYPPEVLAVFEGKSA